MMYVYDKSMAVAYASCSRNKRGRNCERLTLHEAEEQCSLLLAKRSERSGKAADGGDGSVEGVGRRNLARGLMLMSEPTSMQGNEEADGAVLWFDCMSWRRWRGRREKRRLEQEESERVR